MLDFEVLADTTRRMAGDLRPPKMSPKLRIGGRESTERWTRQERYINSVRAPADDSAFERAIGTNDLLSLHYFYEGLRAARAVGKISIPPSAEDRGGVATGFLIAPRVLITNWHVFNTHQVAARARVQFRYESDASGRERASTWFTLLPDELFLTFEDLDFCAVAVDPASQTGPDALADLGWLQLKPQLGKTEIGQYLSIIQHPGGELKQVAIRENEVLPFDDESPFLTYHSDTLRGSSGAPVFNDFWDVVAVHHSGVAEKDRNGNYIGHDGNPIIGRKPEEHEIKWVANEGIRVSRIVARLRETLPAGTHADELTATFEGALVPAVPAPEVDRQTAPRLPLVPAAELAAPAGTVMMVVPLDVSVTVTRPRPLAAPSPAPAIIVRDTSRITPAIAVLEKLNFDPDYDNRPGYNEHFLGHDRPVPMPTLPQNAPVAPLVGGGSHLHYHHFSVVVHRRRRMPIFAASNLDYRKSERDDRARKDFGTDQWIQDPRMDAKYQIPKGFYDDWKLLDYGHLVRRDDNCWGSSDDEIESANADTFHLTNCTPQHEEFNRDMFGFHGLWGRLENTIKRQAEKDGIVSRLSLFAGPIFNDKKDLVCGDVRVPLAFWKVVVAPTAAGPLKVFGFITSQAQDLDDDPPFEDFSPAGFKDQQVSLRKIEDVTLVRFAASLKDRDVMATHPDGDEVLTLESFEDVWTGRR